MKKYFITVIISLIVGFLLSNYILNEYDDFDIKNVFSEKKNAYLIQQGVYSSYESMKSNVNMSDYIYSVVDNMYYVYVGMTLNIENVSKIQDYYKDKNIETIVKTTTLSDKDFISSLEKYDIVLNETNDSDTIKEILKQILMKYKGGSDDY